jgi:large subunit ribosomal protein L29
MKRLKTQELSKLSHEDLVNRENDMRSELSTLRSKAARGTLKKELGEIKTVRRNLARVMTAISIQRISSQVGQAQTESSAENNKEREKTKA